MHNNKKILRLETGNEVISLVCTSKELKSSLEEYFHVQSSDRKPDISIKLNVRYHKTNPVIPDSCFTDKKRDKNGFIIGDNIVRGVIGRNRKKINLFIKYAMLMLPYTRVFEQLLYQAYYSVTQSKKKQAYLFHSSGVIVDGNGYLFIGPSGRGKSTVADLSSRYHVLNDEINIIEFDGDERPLLIGTPFNGLYANKKPGQAACKAIFILNHGPEHEIKEISYHDAVRSIVREIVPTIGLESCIDHMTLVRSFDIAEKIVKSIPVYSLFFRKDPGFWDVILANKEMNH